MPRRPRTYLAGVPCRVVQRRNNRDVCFLADDDYRPCLDVLGDAWRRCRVDMHANVRMTNYVHLLLTPRTVGGVSHVIRSSGRRCVQYVNKTDRRCGNL